MGAQKFELGAYGKILLSVCLPVDENNLLISAEPPYVLAQETDTKNPFYDDWIRDNPDKPFERRMSFRELVDIMKGPREIILLGGQREVYEPRLKQNCDKCYFIAQGEVYSVFLHEHALSESPDPKDLDFSLIHRFGRKDYQYASYRCRQSQIFPQQMFGHLQMLEHNAPIHRRMQEYEQNLQTHE